MYFCSNNTKALHYTVINNLKNIINKFYILIGIKLNMYAY